MRARRTTVAVRIRSGVRARRRPPLPAGDKETERRGRRWRNGSRATVTPTVEREVCFDGGEVGLLAVERLLADAESKSETNPTVKRWMKDLNAAADEADDVLDEFQYEALRREAMSLKSLGHKLRSCMTP
uniref:Disease resistance N-terminal domain-containing protein n=1 Tax=Oryza meridionalis TaxID=40149 RepID=A0A0E0DYK7_9ORYZ